MNSKSSSTAFYSSKILEENLLAVSLTSSCQQCSSVTVTLFFLLESESICSYYAMNHHHSYTTALPLCDHQQGHHFCTYYQNGNIMLKVNSYNLCSFINTASGTFLVLL